ncbi:MAG: AbrB/MazE/SpoVT family DNA-binding domain-containing protein [Bryobacteraceae bacterium]|jgi:AbrB family looped-hinge helix DNA binding protein
MAQVTLSSQNRIVVPREARDAMGIKPGDEILIVTRGGLATLMPKPANYAEALLGVGKGTYPNGYLARERRSWN